MNVGYPEIPNGTGLTDRELSSQWKSIDWSAVKETVNNLQSRLARAAKKCNWFKVRKLIRLLTRSHHAKLLAVKTVTDNKGSKTPGIDGILWTSAADKMKAALSLTGKGYKANSPNSTNNPYAISWLTPEKVEMRLSGVKGNFYAPFFGERRRVTAFSYPTEKRESE